MNKMQVIYSIVGFESESLGYSKHNFISPTYNNIELK